MESVFNQYPDLRPEVWPSEEPQGSASPSTFVQYPSLTAEEFNKIRDGFMQADTGTGLCTVDSFVRWFVDHNPDLTEEQLRDFKEPPAQAVSQINKLYLRFGGEPCWPYISFRLWCMLADFGRACCLNGANVQMPTIDAVLFWVLDSDGDGKVSLKDVTAGYSRIALLNAVESQNIVPASQEYRILKTTLEILYRDLFIRYNSSKNGFLEFEEFRLFLAHDRTPALIQTSIQEVRARHPELDLKNHQ